MILSLHVERLRTRSRFARFWTAAGPWTSTPFRDEAYAFVSRTLTRFDYARLARISVAHLYNLRQFTTYLRKRTVLDRTRLARVAIGERRSPRPDGRPGFVRVDTVSCAPSGG